ncbi:MAG: CHAT domain-containing protein [Imperialibacter sp.]|uniref:CHAT domain-containing protein n=1 Tax=Imperialibacter sp. TaxID=2038411 RepID=UPI003A8A9153
MKTLSFKPIFSITIIFFSVLFAPQANAQLMDKLKKNLTESLTSSPRDKQTTKDTTFYNLAISQGSKVSFFDNREDNQNAFLVGAKNYTDNSGNNVVKLTRAEKVFDSNRSGSIALSISKWSARMNFLGGLNYLLDENYGGSLATSYLSDQILSAYNDNNLFEVVEVITANNSLNLLEKYGLAKTMMNLAILHHSQGQFTIAKSYYEQTETLIKEQISPNSQAMASVLNNLAVLYKDLGQYTEAEKAMGECLRLMAKNKFDDQMEYAVALNNEAILRFELGRNDQAVSSLNKSIELASKHINEKGTDFTKLKINLAVIYQNQKKYTEAEAIYKELLELKEKRFGKSSPDYAEIQNQLAGLYMELGRTDEVEGLLTSAVEIYKKKLKEDHPAYAATLRNLGKYYYFTDQYDKAVATFGDVIGIYERNFGNNHPEYLGTLENMAITRWKKGETDKADSTFGALLTKHMDLLEKYFGAMSENEKGKYWDKVRPSFLAFYNFAAENSSKKPELATRMYEAHLSTKGILLSSSVKLRQNILNSGNQPLIDTYLSWTNLKESLASYYSLSKDELKEQKVNLDSLESSANGLERKLNQMSADFADANKLPSVKLADVAAKLKPGEMAVEIITFPAFDKSFTDNNKYTFAFVKNGAASPELVTISNGKELETRYAKAYRNMVTNKLEDAITYEQFWKPIAGKVAGSKKLYMSLDGVYNQINVITLKATDGSYVKDKHDIVLLSSTRQLAQNASARSGSKNTVLVGFPNYGSKSTLSPLPGTQKEVQAIGALAKTSGTTADVYMQDQATEALLKDKVKNPRILHIATHGFFLQDVAGTEGDKVLGVEISKAKENPLLRSGLFLAGVEGTTGSIENKEVNTADNGILTAYEVLNLNLEQTDMVILSACETGLGEIKGGEGVYGLQRAFQVAGAGSIIMSLWKVNDEATQELMVNFYKEFLKSGDKQVAFAKAQNALKTKYAEPYYWGAFVMMN